MSLEIVNELIDDIVQKRKDYLNSKIKRYPANNFRASDIHDCDRYMVHSILDWDKKALHEESLQAIFDAGNDEEKIVVRDLINLGYSVIHQQNDFEIKNNKKEVIGRGHIDGKILYKERAIPIEIKSMNINVFSSIRKLEDFQKKPHHRKYLRQMQLYLFGNNEEFGIFILSDLQGHYKLIPVVLDYGECENILQRLERNWGFVQRKEYPEPLPYIGQLCDRCAFSHLCLQETKNEGAKFIDNEALEEQLNRREEIKIIVDEYRMIDETIKETFNEIPEAFVGKNWHITGGYRETKRIDTKEIPDDLKEKYSKVTKSWITKIIRI